KRCDCGSVVRLQKCIQIVRASESTLRESLVERTVIAEARSDVAPLRKHRRIWRPPRYIAADGHRPERAPVITLLARNHTVTRILLAFQKVLPHQFDRGFGGLRTTRGEIDPPRVVEILWSKRQYTCRKFFRGRGVKLRRVREGDIVGLFGHGPADLRNAVADADNRGLAGSVQVAAPVGGNYPTAFAAHCHRILFSEIAGK